MAESKTKPSAASVNRYVEKIADETRRNDCVELLGIMKQATGEAPKMWGTGIVGFGSYHYKGASGREGDWFVAGFASRKTDLTIYLMGGQHLHPELLEKLGKHKSGKGCLYIKRLSDVDKGVLKKLIAATVKDIRKTQR